MSRDLCLIFKFKLESIPGTPKIWRGRLKYGGCGKVVSFETISVLKCQFSLQGLLLILEKQKKKDLKNST